MQAYNQVFWDISGACNSNCRYCCNGKRSLSGKSHRANAGVLEPAAFKDALTFLTAKGVIVPGQTRIELYNWGEPFVHPNFEEMLQIVSYQGFHFGLSTNASVIKSIPPVAIPKLTEIRFSMPGFSQNSYDRVHGFRFDVVRDNIRKIIDQIRSISYDVRIGVVFHLYKFNQSEIAAAKEFCDMFNIDFTLIYAYLNGFTMATEYYTGLMPQEDCNDIENELMIDQLEVLRQKRPDGYQCPQYAILTMDEFCNVLQCCGTDRHAPENVVGKLGDVDFELLPSMRRCAKACSLCSYLKIDYMWHTANV